VNAAGSPIPGSSGNGTPPSRNHVDLSYQLWGECKEHIEAVHPEVKQLGFFPLLEDALRGYIIEDVARHIGGTTYYMETPRDWSPMITIYLTYDGEVVTPRAAWATSG
jgi:hypothetical protein